MRSSYDAIIGKTLQGTITDWNGAAERLFGYGAHEAIGRSIRMLIPDDRAAEEMRIIATLTSGQDVAPFDTVRRTKDGRLIDVSITISPIRDARGKVVGAAKIARDVTRERQAEAALRDSQALLRFALGAAQVGDWRLDLATGVLDQSAQCDQCLGLAARPARWTLDALGARLHPDDRAPLMATWRSAIAAGTTFHATARVAWHDGTEHWVSVHGTPADAVGAPRQMVGIMTDITRDRHLAKVREDALLLAAENRRIVDATQAKSVFLANMSHELRTPLNAIIGFADILGANLVPADSPRRTEYLGHIQSSGRHLLRLINDVLDLSKVEAGKFEFFPEPIHLPALLKDVMDLLHTQLLQKRLRVAVAVAPDVADVTLDPARLKQVLFNYLSNAIKFTPEDGSIAVRARAEGPRHFRLEVQDSGIGIAEADLGRLFVEFAQLAGGRTGQPEGTGLGLALSRRLVEAQGGTVGVRSTVGVGSVFHLVLPRTPDGSAPPPVASTTGRRRKNPTGDEAVSAAPGPEAPPASD